MRKACLENYQLELRILKVPVYACDYSTSLRPAYLLSRVFYSQVSAGLQEGLWCGVSGCVLASVVDIDDAHYFVI